MYYWNEDAKESYLEKELLQVNNVRKLQIGTAFFSKEGLRILKSVINKNNLKKENVCLYLSDEFSQDRPHELLKEVLQLATVKIFFHRMYHAKVYLLRGDIDKLIYGSSNFTAGGFYKNIEFDSIEEIGEKKLSAIEHFFDYCDLHATTVTDEVIQYYEEIEDEIKELKKVQKELKNKIKSGYPLQQGAFRFKDYDIEKMMAVHNYIYPQIQRLGLYCTSNLSFLLHATEGDASQGELLSIWYGRSNREAAFSQRAYDIKNGSMGKSANHEKFEFTILSTGFIVRMHFETKGELADRMYTKSQIEERNARITREIAKFKGGNIKWKIFNSKENMYDSFEIDNENTDEICNFIKKYDKGAKSYITVYHPFIDDQKVEVEAIGDEILCHIMMFKPLYDSMLWR